MTTLIAIRTCKRDDYLSRLCAESFKGMGDVVFIGEQADYKYSTPVVIRQSVDNFGGQLGAKGHFESLRLLPDTYDQYIVCDADIVVFRDFTKGITADHAGCGNLTKSGWFHASGQLNVYSNRFFKYLRAMDDEYVEKHYPALDSHGVSIADDTFVSYERHKAGFSFQEINGWNHHKYHNYQGRMDFENVLKEIRCS